MVLGPVHVTRIELLSTNVQKLLSGYDAGTPGGVPSLTTCAQAILIWSATISQFDTQKLSAMLTQRLAHGAAPKAGGVGPHADSCWDMLRGATAQLSTRAAGRELDIKFGATDDVCSKFAADHLQTAEGGGTDPTVRKSLEGEHSPR